MSLKDNKITEQSLTVISWKGQMRQFFNMFDLEKLTFDDHLQLSNYLLKCFGFNFLDEDCNYLFAAFSVIYVSMYTLSGIVYMTNHSDNLTELTDCISTVLFILVIFIKVGFFKYNKTKLQDLISRIRYDHKEIVDKGGMEKDILFKRLLEGRVLTRVFYYSCVLCIIMHFTFPMILHSGDQILPFPTQLFFLPTNGTLWYRINYFYQGSLMVFAINVFAGYEGFCIYSLLMMCARLEILSFRIKQIGVRKEVYYNPTAETEGYSDLSQMLKKPTELYLNDCVVFQQSIYRFAIDWNIIYHYDFFVELLFTGLIGCVSLHQVTVRKVGDAAPFYTYIILCMLQMFVFCWYGETLRSQSLGINAELYGIRWYQLDPSLRKTFQIMFIRSQKPITVSAIFTNVTLAVFSDLLRKMYSFYALLVNTE